MKTHIKKILELFFIFLFFIESSGMIFLSSLFIKNNRLETYSTHSDKVSKILDKDGNVVVELNLTKDNNITYEELPDVFINALISSEDARFFSHSGIDLQRIISALINNATTGETHGASTLTQQLIKNTVLDSSKTMIRKLNEIILALKLENKISKEDIIEAYCNNILFDGISLGVNNASLRLFNKHISNVTLPQAALLAGILNAPSLYNPIKNPDNAKKRMDTVLLLMHRHGYIDETELKIAKNTQISDLLNIHTIDTETYPYQAYLDIVYKESLSLINKSFLSTPLIIETELDTDIQETIDQIQKGNVFNFIDDNQQFAMSLIDNTTGALVASMGGRNYEGKLLFNRSYDMLKQPASTIKPLLSYALAIETLNYNSKQVLNDIPFNYSTGQNVNNVDHTYMGELLIEDAIGYSRNTTALSTLNDVINLKGINYVTNYLNKINLLDVEAKDYQESYALGGFKYGVSVQNLASAYSMIVNKGYYTPAYTIKKITDSVTNKVIYSRNNHREKILSESTCDILTSILKNVVDSNYYGLGSLKLKDTGIYLKSGTSSFDNASLKKYNYPSNASKDLWLAGFTKEYSFSIWSGFDSMEINKENYFKSGTDKRKTHHKEILKYVLEKAIKEKGDVKLTDGVVGVNIVKGTNLLPDINTPSNMIVKAYFKKGHEPTQTIAPIPLKEITNVDVLFYNNKINILFNDYLTIDIEKENTIYSNNKVYGDIEYVIELNGNTYISDSPDFFIDNTNNFIYEIKAYTRYKNANNILSNVYQKDFLFI